jgi:hypothetical protein
MDKSKLNCEIVTDVDSMVLRNALFVSQFWLQGADIIVFPECGLSTIYLPENRPEIRPLLTPIPDPIQRKNPCMDSSGDVPEVTVVLSVDLFV